VPPSTVNSAPFTAVRVEVLRSLQDPSECPEGCALGARVLRLTGGGLTEPAVRYEADLVGHNLALRVEEFRSAVNAFREADAQLVHAVKECVRGLLASPGILPGQEVDVVTMRGGKRQLVLVRRSDSPELAVIPARRSIDRGSKQLAAEPPSTAQASAARVMRSCSRF
jgi:hypothetical protein